MIRPKTLGMGYGICDYYMMGDHSNLVKLLPVREDEKMPAQKLSYLKNNKISPGKENFITNVDFTVECGKADMQLYDIFPGIQLMITDFNTATCYRNCEKQNVIGINHCSRGRFECELDNRNYLYMGEGDIAISSMVRPPIGSSFPVNYYFGSTILLFQEICEEVPELKAFGIDVKQIVLEENREYLPKTLTEKIKHVKEHMTEDLEHRVSLKELAEEHERSLTQLKSGFKQIYGETPYAYLRSYKMHVATKMLQQSDKKISEIALELGYQNPSKFTKAFSAVIGCMPSKYRESHTRRK